MQVVKFKDGTFAVRRGFFWYQYLDSVTCSKWWNNLVYAKKYARVSTLAEAHTLMSNYNPQPKDKGTPV